MSESEVADHEPSPDEPAESPGASAEDPTLEPVTLSRAALTGLELLTEIYALALGSVLLASGDGLTAILASNRMAPLARNGLVVTFAMVALAVAGGMFFVARSRRLFQTTARVAELALPLLPLAFLPAFLDTKTWFSQPFEYLVLLAAYGWSIERIARRAGPAWSALCRGSRAERLVSRCANATRAPLWTVLVLSLAYVVYSSHLTILNHHRLGTGAFDLGIFDNMMWNALHGQPFRSTIMYGLGPGNSIAGHAEYGMLLFLPFYAIHPSSETLLVLQSAILGFAALPLFFFASTQLPRWGAALIAVLYLFYAPLHGAQYYDFHWLPLLVFFAFWLFYGIAVGKKRHVIAPTLVLFLLREDIAPGVAMTGLFLVLVGFRARWGALLAVSAAVWFAINKFAIMPYFGTWFFADLYSKLAAPGEKGYASVIKTLLVNPLFVLRSLMTAPKLEYVLHILVPLALLPLRRLPFLLLLVPGVFFTILTNWPAAISLKYQYSTHWTPYVFGASVLYLSQLRRKPPLDTSSRPVTQSYGAALFALTTCLLCHTTIFGFIIQPSSFVGGWIPVRFSMTAEERERSEELHSLIARIPADASVTATDIEVPHLSNRRDVFAIAQDRTAGRFLLLNPTSFHLAQTKAHVRELLTGDQYGFVARAGRMTLWEKGHVSTRTAPERILVRQEIARSR